MAIKQPIARRKPVNKVSPKRAAEQRVYTVQKREFLKWHPLCEAQLCGEVQNLSCDVHHIRGRAGTLYLDVRHWLAVCRPCHDWIHNNRKQAVKLGLLAPPELWNVADRTAL